MKKGVKDCLNNELLGVVTKGYVAGIAFDQISVAEVTEVPRDLLTDAAELRQYKSCLIEVVLGVGFHPPKLDKVR